MGLRAEKISSPKDSKRNSFLSRKEQSKPLFFQPKLTVGPTDDVYEREADAVADKVMRMSDKEQVQTKSLPINIQRKCAACEEEEQLQRKEDGTKEDEAEAPSIVADALGSGGKPLDDTTRSFMESRFGYDFVNVKVHTDSVAAKSAQAIDALAYTSGNNIVFNQGQYSPQTENGKKLMAHELTHVIQQSSSSNSIQRTINGSNTPRTLTNCHNWKIPLPPWIAGTLAHSQIAAFTAGAGVVPHLIPRATKVLRTLPSPPFGTPPGFADLWWNTGADVKVGEIKSTAAGDAAAHPEARHYRDRHNQWLSRLAFPPLALDDSLYLSAVGAPIPGSLIDLSGFTGAGISLGPFIGDPLKQLHIEADSLGAMVYWCTGVGLINPVWVLVLKNLLDRLKNLLDQLKRLMQEIGRGIGEALDWLGENAPVIAFVLLVIALVALAILIIACAIAAPETGGLTAICSYLGLLGAIEVLASILIILGFSSEAGQVREVGGDLARASATETESAQLATAEDYEQTADRAATGNATSSGSSRNSEGNPAERFVAALSPIMSFGGIMTMARNVTSPPAGTRDALNHALAILDRAGDSNTAALIRSGMTRIS